MSAESRNSKIHSVIRVSSGNFLEMYDFMVYAYYASYIAREIFPLNNTYASLMLTLGTFGAGYLMRPLGAVILGAYMDRHGRRSGLIFTLLLMAIGTVVIAFTPPYRSIGLIAPIVVLLGRLLQGFSAGVQVGGASVYLAEIATPGNRGFYCAFQSGSQQIAVVFAALLGVVLNSFVPAASMNRWGWRVPFMVGCLIVPLLYWLRQTLAETEDFLARKVHPTVSQIYASLAANWKIVTIGMMLDIDHGLLLPHYSVHADIRNSGSASDRSPKPAGHVGCWVVEFCVVADWRRYIRPGGTPADGRLGFDAGEHHSVSRDAVDGGRALDDATADCRTLAVRDFRRLQWRDGALPCGNHAGGYPDVRIFRGVQLGNRDLWRIYSGDLHVSDPRDRESRHARRVAGFCRCVRLVCFANCWLAAKKYRGCGAIQYIGGLGVADLHDFNSL